MISNLPAIHDALAYHGSDELALAVAAWLDAAYRRSGSGRTVAAYRETLTRFTEALASVGLELTSDARAVALVAQRWAWAGQRGDVAPATAAMRLTILSSFYAFAAKRGLAGIASNPIDRIERPRVQQYARARALDPASVKRALAGVRQRADAGDLLALRDLAYLRVALTTGRRLAELAGLRWRDVRSDGATVTLTFRAKGGRLMRDALAPDVARDLLRWLHAWYGGALAALAGDAPLWVRRDGRALTAQACGDIVRRHLGVNPHATRHTYAHAMRRAGAADSIIQQRLGHASLATTGRYLASLDSAVNPFGDALAAMF